MRHIPIFLLCLCLPLSAAAADNTISSSSEDTDFRNSGAVQYQIETYEGLRMLRKTWDDKAYAIWVEQGFKGDLQALALAAMLCKAEETQPSGGRWIRLKSDKPPAPICPVPAKFWEDSLVSLLGEGEGYFMLGLFGMEILEHDPFKRMEAYKIPVEDYMLRSARTGHADGLYGAWLTNESRDGKPFTPPIICLMYLYCRRNMLRNYPPLKAASG